MKNLNKETLDNTLEETINADIFKSEIKTWAERIGVEYKEVRLRPMKSKWGSCSSRGRLTFDTGLLSMPAPFRAKIIAHELLHLKIPNHGKLFSALLKSYLSKYK